mmetsp:Transcript_57042/g.135690  ORF Transcript_57042/g.135690 Transcript_57042/m.135690 type:complete len:231 (-) Transcript_57042:754-1446(-)
MQSSLSVLIHACHIKAALQQCTDYFRLLLLNGNVQRSGTVCPHRKIDLVVSSKSTRKAIHEHFRVKFGVRAQHHSKCIARHLLIGGIQNFLDRLPALSLNQAEDIIRDVDADSAGDRHCVPNAARTSIHLMGSGPATSYLCCSAAQSQCMGEVKVCQYTVLSTWLHDKICNQYHLQVCLLPTAAVRRICMQHHGRHWNSTTCSCKALDTVLHILEVDTQVVFLHHLAMPC